MCNMLVQEVQLFEKIELFSSSRIDDYSASL